jgi:hypothetical protein
MQGKGISEQNVGDWSILIAAAQAALRNKD